MPQTQGGDVTSPVTRHEGTAVLMSPAHRPPTLADLMRGTGSPPARGGVPGPDVSSPAHLLSRPPRARHKRGRGDNISRSGGGDQDSAFHGTNSLPHRHRTRKLTLGHVKSLGDVTENKHDDVIFCDGKEIDSLEKIQREIILGQSGVKHLKSVSDPKSVYSVGKMEPESEIYFADVSSCVSIRPDSEEVMYYSDPTSSGSQQYSMKQQLYIDPSLNYPHNLSSSIASSHMYEQVKEENEEDEDIGSHHTSDDTMIVHTSSSDPSFAGDTEAGDTENTYSVISPATDVSPMATDTDGYSCYTPLSPVVNDVPNTAQSSDINMTTRPLPPTTDSNSLVPNNNTNKHDDNKNTTSGPAVRSSTTSNLNLHHPLHPIRLPQHQAYHHHLSHHRNPVDAVVTKSNVEKKKREKKAEKRSDKCQGKRSCRNSGKTEKITGTDPQYETVVTTEGTRVSKSSPSKGETDANPKSKLNSSGHSPSKHKHHRLRKHHHHHHHTQAPVASSSSSSSSLSSPRLPPILDASSDPNGNTTTSPAHVMSSESPTNKGSSDVSTTKLSVTISKKLLPDSGGAQSPLKKPRPNLSLPLRKLSPASQDSKTGVSEAKISSTTKDKDTPKKKSHDKTKTPKSADTRRHASKDTAAARDVKNDAKSPTIEVEAKVPKRVRRTKHSESPETRKPQTKETTPVHEAPASQDTESKATSDNKEDKDGEIARRSTNVQHLLHNLKSVNV